MSKFIINIYAFLFITVKLPRQIAQNLQPREIIFFLLDKALTKVEFYRSKCREFEYKYKKDLNTFKKEVETSVENFALWDDLIMWEGYMQALQEWEKKYEELKSVLGDH